MIKDLTDQVLEDIDILGTQMPNVDTMILDARMVDIQTSETLNI